MAVPAPSPSPPTASSPIRRKRSAASGAAPSHSPPSASSPIRRKRSAALVAASAVDTVAAAAPNRRGPSTGPAVARESTDPGKDSGSAVGGRRKSPVTVSGPSGRRNTGSDPGLGRIGPSPMERREVRVMGMEASMAVGVSIGGARRERMVAVPSPMDRREARVMGLEASMAVGVGIRGARRNRMVAGTGGAMNMGMEGSRATRGRVMAGMMRRGLGSRAIIAKSKGKNTAALNMAMTLMKKRRSTTTIITAATMMMNEPLSCIGMV